MMMIVATMAITDVTISMSAVPRGRAVKDGSCPGPRRAEPPSASWAGTVRVSVASIAAV